MTNITVKIEKIYNKKTASGKYTFSIISNKVYYGLGLFDSSAVPVINGVSLKEGMTVSFDYTTNGNFKNITTKSLKVGQGTVDESKSHNTNSTNNKNAGSSSNKKASKGTGNTTKVFGPIIKTNQNSVIIEDEKQGNFEIRVEDGPAYKGQVLTVHERIAAVIDENGQIVSGFKWYAPVGAKQKQEGGDLAIRLGNAVTVANHLVNDVHEVVPLAILLVPMIDGLRQKMVEKYPNMDNYAVGARTGQTVIIAAEKTKNIEDFIEVAESLFIELCEAEQYLRENKKPSEKTAKALEEADVIEESMNNSDDVPPYTEEDFAGIGDEPAEDDWDDDLPF